MAFVTLTIVFKTFFNFEILFFIVYMLPSLVKYGLHKTLLFSRKGASVHNIIFKRIFYDFIGFDTGI